MKEVFEIGQYEHGLLVLVVVILYMLMMIGVGVWSARRVKDSTDYIVAGRRLGTFFNTGTLFATWFCAGTLMGATAQAYLFGQQGCIFDPWGAALCLLLAGLFFNRLMRRTGFLTLVDFFDSRYGRKMGLASTIVLVTAETGWVGAQLVAFGTILEVFTGLPLAWGITISTVVVVAYTMLGGMWSVTITDVIQMMILAAGLLIILPFAVDHIGGWGYLFEHGGNWAGLDTWALWPTKDGGYLGYFGIPAWFYYIGAWMSIGLGSIPAQDLMQRVLSAKSEKVACRSSYYASALYLTIGMIPVLLGIAMFEVHPELTIDQTDQILPWMAMNWLPPILAAVFVAGMVAALMSSCDSALLAISSMVGYNGLKFIKPDATSELTLKVTRIVVPIAAVCSLLLALYLETIYMLVVIAWSIILVGLFAPFVAGYFWKKCNGSAALTALIGGFVSWVGLSFYYYYAETAAANTGVVEEGEVYVEWAMWDAVYIASVPAFLISVGLLVVTTLLTYKKYAPIPLCDINGKPLVVKDFVGWGFGKRAEKEDAEAA
ncbi:MAG TPA: sodium:solute symporter family protein [Thermoleophilia bacterium]|nr:sodium:solute symporter family protein [Thermoleophilia bacterium]